VDPGDFSGGGGAAASLDALVLLVGCSGWGLV